MAETCEQHSFEVAVDLCDACRHAFCPDCLVYPHGLQGPALCIPCAIEFSGVRAKAGRIPKKQPRKPAVESVKPVAKASATAGVVTVKIAGAVAGGVAAGTILRSFLL
jgi:hypothetical protein